MVSVVWNETPSRKYQVQLWTETLAMSQETLEGPSHGPAKTSSLHRPHDFTKEMRSRNRHLTASSVDPNLMSLVKDKLAENTKTPQTSPTPRRQLPEEGSLTLSEISGEVKCDAGMCLYYFLEVPQSGNYVVEVLDVTESIVHSSRIKPQALDVWGSKYSLCLRTKCLCGSVTSSPGMG